MSDSIQLPSAVMHLFDGISLVAVVTGIAKGFEWLEGILGPNGKLVISQWIKGSPTEGQEGNWSSVFSGLIDKVFGSKPLSWRFFYRSCLASLFAACVLTIIYWRLIDPAGKAFIPASSRAFFEVFFPLVIIANFFPDYVSLLVSRQIVRWMAKDQKPVRIFALLLLDSLTTFIVTSLGVFFASLVLNSLIQSKYCLLCMPTTGLLGGSPVPDAWGALMTFYRGRPLPWGTDIGTPYGVFFYSSFFTSVWVWLYVLAGVSIQSLRRVRKLWSIVVPFLDIDAKPLTAIGRVAGLIAGVCYAVALAVLGIAKSVHR